MSQITIRDDSNGPVPDSYMDSSASGSNFGSATSFRVGWSSAKVPVTERGILNFPLSALPGDGENINLATLRLYCQSGHISSPAGKIRRITQSGWVESQVTWDDYATSTAWTSGGGDYTTTDPAEVDITLPSTGGDWDYDITDLVRDAIDKRSNELHILIMRATESGSDADVTFSSGENATAGNRPELIIDYDYADRLEPLNKLRSRIPMSRRRTPIVGSVL